MRSSACLKKGLSAGIRHLILLTGVVIIVLPLFYALISSFKPSNEIFTAPIKWIPSRIVLSNYVKPFHTYPFARFFFNSFFVTSTVTALSLFICSMAGYGFAKFDFPYKNALFMLVLVTLMLPVQATFLPLYLIVKALGWLDSYQVLIVPNIVNAFYVFMFRQFLQTIPSDYMDAARIDGSTEFSIYLRIMVPMFTPAIAAAGILCFQSNWQSYFWPLITITKEKLMTLPLGLVNFQQLMDIEYGQLFAMSVLSMLPTLIIFILFQRRLISMIVISGLKA